MAIDWRTTLKDAAPTLLGAFAALTGFVLMRVSAIYESYVLLFVSFALMVWGIVMLFAARGRPARWPDTRGH